MSASRTLLLSLLGFTCACGPDAEGTATDTEGSSGAATEPGPSTGDTEPGTGDTEPTTGDTDAADTETGGPPVFPMCEEPAGPDDIGFDLSGEGLPPDPDLDMPCTIVASQTAPDFSVTIALTCTDAMNVAYALTLDLRLFAEVKLGDLGAAQVRLVYRQVDAFNYKTVLALRDVDDDALLLFAASGYELFTTEDKALWAPLGVSPVAEVLCATEAGCTTVTRGALDITLGEVTQRVFDRAWTTFGSPGLAVHVGAARRIDRYTMDACSAGDEPEGFETTVVVIAEK
jgi:hypothetical protein